MTVERLHIGPLRVEENDPKSVVSIANAISNCLADAFDASPETPWSVDNIRLHLENPVGQGLVAYTKGSASDFLGALLYQLSENEAEICTFGVSEAAKGKGLGQGLLRELIQKLSISGCKRVLLEVRAGNLAAQHIYRKLGFSMLGRRKNYYRLKDVNFKLQREDAVVMHLCFY